ncbi:NVEALA domain-containing protein [uncultured Mediterranea sp.]|uniref:NVEALA domain-containing protein n=1 Tax=uncultured Mediterranea sp. TaxID=1926662 RepID=UPI0028049A1F|nr:NVEALA domain-containing protein [uncultured Mediterranea sp.]
MKKNIMKVALVAAVAAMAGYGVYAHQSKEMMSDVMLENVEALATDESNQTYDKVDKIVKEMIDPITGKPRKIVTIVCDDPGPLVCE